MFLSAYSFPSAYATLLVGKLASSQQASRLELVSCQLASLGVATYPVPSWWRSLQANVFEGLDETTSRDNKAPPERQIKRQQDAGKEGEGERRTERNGWCDTVGRRRE